MDTPNPLGLDPSALEALLKAIVAETVPQTVAQAAEAIFQANQGGLPVARAWIGKDAGQVRKYGESRASYYVYWIDPAGKQRSKSCGPGPEGQRNAQKLRRQVEAQLLTGTYQSNLRKEWEEFRQEYDAKIVAGLSLRTQEEIKAALDHFERLMHPKRVSAINTGMVDDFRAKRRLDRGKQPGSTTSPATVNKSLRHLRAALGKARKWGYLAEVPDFEMERQPKKLPRPIQPEHFAALYRACEQATQPDGFPFTPADWWRALLVVIHMTGRRIGALLALPWVDVDLEKAVLLSQAEDNKGKRDQFIPLHPVAIEHLRRLRGFHESVFPWRLDKTALYAELHRLEDLAEVPRYGFHSVKRAFCTLNAPRISRSAMQFLAEHASFQTTEQFYINPTSEIEEAVGKLYVPDVAKGQAG